MEIVTTMTKLLLAIAAGFFLRKRGVLSKDTDSGMSQVILQVSMPALILGSASGLNSPDAALSSDAVLRLIWLGFLFYALMVPLAWLLARFLKTAVNLRGTTMLMLMFPNAVFMGYPVVSAFLGREAVFYTTVFHLPFNLLFFTLGLYLIQKDHNPEHRFSLGNFLTPGVVASLAAIILYFSGLNLPSLLTESLGFIGSLTPPLSLVVIGSGLAANSLRELFGQHRLYWISLLRLFLIPLGAMLLTRVFLNNPMAIQVVALTVAMPIASAVGMGSAQYPEQGKFAAQAVGLTTLLAMLSIPLWFAFIGG